MIQRKMQDYLFRVPLCFVARMHTVYPFMQCMLQVHPSPAVTSFTGSSLYKYLEHIMFVQMYAQNRTCKYYRNAVYTYVSTCVSLSTVSTFY